ncbi:MAG: type ISP restriction/modification enzyme [Arenibacter latericius]|nr:type ISP restriction/modification enzyme [Arenibacter latericius]
MNKKENPIFFHHLFRKKMNALLSGGKEGEDSINLSLLHYVEQLGNTLGLSYLTQDEIAGNVCFVNSPELRDDYKTSFSSKDILNFCYAVWHSESYREKNLAYLENDFLQLPYPKGSNTFWRLAAIGGELLAIHNIDAAKVEKFIANFPQEGNNTITARIEEMDWEIVDGDNNLGRVWINDQQYFDNIPLSVWELKIGGNLPAKKWLKDRKGNTLEVDDITEYQKIITTLLETDSLIKEIDKIMV